jgi:hypothetical protein
MHHSLLIPTEPTDQGVYDITTLGRPDQPITVKVDDHLIDYLRRDYSNLRMGWSDGND